MRTNAGAAPPWRPIYSSFWLSNDESLLPPAARSATAASRLAPTTERALRGAGTRSRVPPAPVIVDLHAAPSIAKAIRSGLAAAHGSCTVASEPVRRARVRPPPTPFRASEPPSAYGARRYGRNADAPMRAGLPLPPPTRRGTHERPRPPSPARRDTREASATEGRGAAIGGPSSCRTPVATAHPRMVRVGGSRERLPDIPPTRTGLASGVDPPVTRDGDALRPSIAGSSPEARRPISVGPGADADRAAANYGPEDLLEDDPAPPRTDVSGIDGATSSEDSRGNGIGRADGGGAWPSDGAPERGNVRYLILPPLAARSRGRSRSGRNRDVPLRRGSVISGGTCGAGEGTGARTTEPPLMTRTVAELREMCRDRRLPTAGRKTDLVERLSARSSGGSADQAVSDDPSRKGDGVGGIAV